MNEILVVLLLLLAGMVGGYLFREKIPQKTVDLLLRLSVYLLLFLMGVAIGSNREIMDNLLVLGWQSVILTAGAVVGSLVFAWLLWKFFKIN